MSSDETESTIVELENQTFEENDSISVPPEDVFAYNELRSCADLYRMYQEKILEIQPRFQRQKVWTKAAKTRFIDSLVKQLPIPSMCFALDYKTQNWQVIDGLQRMWAIIQFLEGQNWRFSSILDVDPSLAGRNIPDFKKAKMDFDSDLRQYYLRVENFPLPITVIRCDSSKTDHLEYLFTIFHRLNTGGTKLNNQEIRNCIYSGSFNSLLREIDENETWLKITGRSSVDNDRYLGQERILRVFAFQDCYPKYAGRLATFLNEYMKKHREPSPEFLASKKELFYRTIRIFGNSILEGSAAGRISRSVIEATLVGIALNLDFLEGQPAESIRIMYRVLQNSDEFTDEKLREGLSGKPRVLGRMSAAEQIFSSDGNGH